jgi:hypothetical protein
MKKLLVILFLFLTILSFAEKKIGYLICVSQEKQTFCTKTLDLHDAYDALKVFYPEVTVNFDEILSYQNFFELRTPSVELYIEKKRARINRKGELILRRLKRNK